MLLAFEQSMRLGGTGLWSDADDMAICDYAEAKSKQINKEIFDFAERLGVDAMMDYVTAECARAGVELPLSIARNDDAETIRKKKEGALARIIDPLYWRRKLRAKAARNVEKLLREWGFVGRGAGMYCSDYTLLRRREQRKRSADLLSGMEAQNQFGFVAGLDELAEKGMANPENRRCELMTRIRGFEEIAQSLEHSAVFYTLTAPSKYHAIKSTGKRNEKFNGATPAETMEYLNSTWARIRSEWHRNGIRCYGFRIVEPHHDGTPHWHLLIFMPQENETAATEIFRKHALVVDGIEDGAQKYRFTAVKIDWSRGSAAGYIAKYVAKNIVGHDHGMAGDIDLEGDGSLQDNAERVEAWASTWGIRQFQQIGAVSVTVWRELRRNFAGGEMPVALAAGELAVIRACCDRGDWAAYVTAVGGALARRDQLAVRALNVLADDENKYGELFCRVRGVIMRGTVAAVTRLYNWQIRKKRKNR